MKNCVLFCTFTHIPDDMRAITLSRVFRLLAVDSRINFRNGSGTCTYSKFPACSLSRSLNFPVLSLAYRNLSSIPACLWPSNLPRATEWGYGVPASHVCLKKAVAANSVGTGPDTWPSKYPDAGGSSQSPVDIVSSIVQSRTYDPPLMWKYGPGVCKSIINTGSGWRVDMQGADSVLSGGPLTDSYEPVQFHCHWGDIATVGSEHTIDGKCYAGELHFVHWNRDKYATCPEALKSPQGLTVIGVLLEEGEKNSELEKLCDVLPQIADFDQRVELPVDIDPVAMFPADQSYWTYPGSLTTPPCYESVTWVLFKNSITVSQEQLNCFRQMKKPCNHGPDGASCLVDYNHRPLQSLNDREICECV